MQIVLKIIVIAIISAIIVRTTVLIVDKIIPTKVEKRKFWKKHISDEFKEFENRIRKDVYKFGFLRK